MFAITMFALCLTGFVGYLLFLKIGYEWGHNGQLAYFAMLFVASILIPIGIMIDNPGQGAEYFFSYMIFCNLAINCIASLIISSVKGSYRPNLNLSNPVRLVIEIIGLISSILGIVSFFSR
jgi:hypothetical protein